MKLRMKDVVALSGQSKSKVLYYIKEGLLPKPKVIHKNLHLYDESIINRLKFIQYLQDNFSYSIEQIKTILKNNKLNFNSSFENIIKSLQAISIKDSKEIEKESFLQELNITQDELELYCKKGYILNCNKLTKTELDIVKILHEAKVLNLDFELIDTYVLFAKAIAKKENDIGSKLLQDDSQAHNRRYELLFDIILKLKPYIFNSYTIKEHQERIKND